MPLEMGFDVWFVESEVGRLGPPSPAHQLVESALVKAGQIAADGSERSTGDFRDLLLGQALMKQPHHVQFL